MKAFITLLFVAIITIAFGQQQISFCLADVEKNTKSLSEVHYKNAISHRTNNVTVDCSDNGMLVPSEIHPFVETLNHCYDEHRPLILSPDMFWLLICQGFSQHINVNAEQFQNSIVDFEGVKTISVRRDDFIFGSDNPWQEVIPAFAEEIRTNIGDTLFNLLIPSFTTTTVDIKAAYEICLMQTVKEYYVNELTTYCGIPQITIEGTLEDWKWIKDNIHNFDNYDLEWWTNELDPILDKICKTVQGEINTDFWNNIYKISDQSGGPYIHGWIIKFFPYIRKDGKIIRNKYVNESTVVDVKGFYWYFGLLSANFLSGLSEVGFTWKYYSDELDLKFVAGFVGIKQDKENLSLKPEIGWAITR
jgi:hypothetical protein